MSTRGYRKEQSVFGGGDRKWREQWERRRLRRRVVKGLTLTPRGAVASDRLWLRDMSLALTVEWYARDLHPWDCDLPAERRAEVFTSELMADTVVAIRQMFDRLPEVGVIDVRVLEPNEPHQALLAGTVHREDLSATQHCPSPAMNLRLLGVHCRVPDRRDGHGG
jgi:hypothetical protein